MSYLKKIEEDYNNGIISLDEINEKREIYYKLGKDQKVEINTKYASVLKENNNVEPVSNDKTDIPNTSFFSSYYFLSILVVLLYLFIKLIIVSGGDIGSFYKPLEYFFIEFVSFIVIVFPLSLMATIFAKKGDKYIKIFFWTLLIFSIIKLIIL